MKLSSIFRSRESGRSIWACDEGVTVLETVFVFPPLLMMTFAAFEISFMYFAQNAFDLAVSNIARAVKTRQIADLGITTPGPVKTRLCNQLISMGNFDCDNDLRLSVTSRSDLTNITWPNPISGGSLSVSDSYDDGDPNVNVVVVMRAYITWDVISPPLWLFYPNAPQDNATARVLGSVRVFVNEGGTL